jgi:glycosyltransferase involved in cell wall biosynthesis
LPGLFGQGCFKVPKVSVCIPTYNHPELVLRTLLSVLEQDFEDYELIITDDSEGDGVRDLVAGISDYRIHYYKNVKQLGSPANWNRAISLAKGEYIKILHHDDWFANAHSLSQFVKLLDVHPTSVLGFSAAYACGRDGTADHVHAPSERQLEELRQCPAGLAFDNYIGAPSVTIFRGNTGLRFDEQMKWLVDVDFYIGALATVDKFYSYTSEPQVCVSFGADHQVTNDCSGKQEVEIYEHVHLYRKMGQMQNKLPLIRSLLFYSFLFSRFGVRSVSEYFKVAQVKEISWMHRFALLSGSAIHIARRVKRKFIGNLSGS